MIELVSDRVFVSRRTCGSVLKIEVVRCIEYFLFSTPGHVLMVKVVIYRVCRSLKKRIQVSAISEQFVS